MLRQWSETNTREGSVTKTAYLGERTDYTYYTMGLIGKESEAWVFPRPVNNACILFQGPTAIKNKSAVFTQSIQPCTVLANNGICCYVDGLRSLTGDPEVARLIHVLPGHIRHQDRPYREVRDRESGFSRLHNASITEIAQITPASTDLPEGSSTLMARSKKKPFNLQVIAFEDPSETTLFCFYRVFTPTTSIDLQPALLMIQILERSGQIACSKSSLCRKRLVLPCSTVHKGWTVDPDKTENLKFSSHLACCIWPDRDDMEKCIVLGMQSTPGAPRASSSGVFLRRSECLPCCSKAILREGGKFLAGQSARSKVILHVI